MESGEALIRKSHKLNKKSSNFMFQDKKYLK